MINIKRPNNSLKDRASQLAPNLFNIASILFVILIVGFSSYIIIRVSTDKNSPKAEVAGIQTSRVETTDLLNTIAQNSNYKYFFDALTKTGDYQLLKQRGPYTIFVPEDSAFTKLGQSALTELFADPVKLKNMVENHIVQGSLKKLDFGKVEFIRSVSGKTINIDQTDLGTMFNNAKLMSSEINSNNGVIYELDSVIN